MMIWQLLQVGQLRDIPLIFAGPMLGAGCRTGRGTCMLRPGFELAGPQDLSIPQCVDGADAAVALIREHQRDVAR